MKTYTFFSASVATALGTAVEFPWSGRIVGIHIIQHGLAAAANPSVAYLEISKLPTNQTGAGTGKEIVATAVMADEAGNEAVTNIFIPCNYSVGVQERWYANFINTATNWQNQLSTVHFIFA